MQSASKDGVLTFSSKEFNEFAAPPGRDYHLFIWLNSRKMASMAPQLDLPLVRKEYGLVAQVGG